MGLSSCHFVCVWFLQLCAAWKSVQDVTTDVWQHFSSLLEIRAVLSLKSAGGSTWPRFSELTPGLTECAVIAGEHYPSRCLAGKLASLPVVLSPVRTCETQDAGFSLGEKQGRGEKHWLVVVAKCSHQEFKLSPCTSQSKTARFGPLPVLPSFRHGLVCDTSSAKRIPYVCSTRNPIGLWYRNWACLWTFDPCLGKMKIRSTRNFKSNVSSASAWIIYVLTKINLTFYSCLEQCEVPLQGFPDCSYLVIKSSSCFCQKQYVQLPKGDYFFCIPPLPTQDLPGSICTSSSLSATLVSLVVRPWFCKLMPGSAVHEKSHIYILPGGILFRSLGV